MKKNIIIPTVALFVICLVCTLLLALANNVTEPKIAESAANKENASISTVLPGTTNPEEKKLGDISYRECKDDSGEVLGYVFITSAKSYGGEVQVMTGIGADGKITGVDILSINDTPGLGMNAKKDEFKNGFKGLIGDIVVQKNSADASKNEIQALTGATITSKAVSSAVNEAYANYETVTNGGAN